MPVVNEPGAWTLPPGHEPGEWHWEPGATPDPTLVQQYGPDAITNPQRDPSGNQGAGTWVDETSGEGHNWVFHWGREPDPATVNEFGHDRAIDPTVTPTGGPVFEPDQQARPSAVPLPELRDGWPGGVPDLTPFPDPPPGTAGATETEPPPGTRPYFVSPGDVRDDVMTPLHNATNACMATYNQLVALIEESRSWRAYRDQGGFADMPSVMEIQAGQTSLARATAGMIDLASYMNDLLEPALRNYVTADVRSRLPQ